MKVINFPDTDTEADADNAAAELFRLYIAYVRAGFDRHQAMEIICTMLRASLSNPPPPKASK